MTVSVGRFYCKNASLRLVAVVMLEWVAKICPSLNLIFLVLQLFKNVAERGHWSDMVMEAHTMYREHNTDSALVMYAFLAELGYEVAQSNVAYILDEGEHHFENSCS